MSNLTSKELERQKALIARAKELGIDVNDLLPSEWSRSFTVGPNGYFVKQDGTFYDPTDPQEAFLSSKARFSLFYGSRGSGKTTSGSQKALLKIKEGQPGAIYNPDFENLRTSTWPEFREWIDWDMVVPSQRYRKAEDWEPARPFNLTFNNGVNIRVKGIKDPSAARGPNINWLWYDEAQRDETGEAWQTAVASVRIGTNPQAFCTATPSGKDHWMYKFFMEEDIPEEAKEAYQEAKLDYPMIQVFHGTIRDNKENLDPGFYASMLAAYSDGWFRQQEIGGYFVDQGGVLGDRSWFAGKILQVVPDLDIKKRVRYWDLAATEKKLFGKKKNDPDESVGTKMSHAYGNKFYIEHQHGGHWEWAELKENIMRTAMKDTQAVPIILEKEPGSGGKNQVAAIKEWMNDICDRKGIPRFQVEGWKPPNDRVSLANIWFGEASKEKVYLIQGEWNEKFLDQLAGFPTITHDDRITSVTGARMNVAPIQTWTDIEFIAV